MSGCGALKRVKLTLQCDGCGQGNGVLLVHYAWQLQLLKAGVGCNEQDGWGCGQAGPRSSVLECSHELGCRLHNSH